MWKTKRGKVLRRKIISHWKVMTYHHFLFWCWKIFTWKQDFPPIHTRVYAIEVIKLWISDDITHTFVKHAKNFKFKVSCLCIGAFIILHTLFPFIFYQFSSHEIFIQMISKFFFQFDTKMKLKFQKIIKYFEVHEELER